MRSPVVRSEVIQVIEGPVGEELAAPRSKRPGCQIAAEQLLLNIPGLLRIKVQGGRSITFQRLNPRCLNDDVQALLLSQALAGAFVQRGLLVLNGSAVQVGRRTLLICGPPGSGRSTLAAGLMTRGHQALADGLCLIGAKNSLLWPGLPRLELYPDSRQHLGLDGPGAASIRPGIARGYIELRDRADSSPKPIAITDLIHLGGLPDVRGGSLASALRGMAAFRRLHAALYDNILVDALGCQAETFKALQRLNKRLRVHDLHHPLRFDALNASLDVIESLALDS